MNRLKLREDAYYAATDDGICILTSSGEVELTGPSIYQWVDRLAPYLDGRHTLAELTASMPAERRAMVERIVNTLRERGVVIEATDAAEQPPGFAAVGESTVLVVGAGGMLEETRAAARCAGLRRLPVLVAGESLNLSDEDDVRSAVAGADLVVYAGDRADGAAALDRACARADIPAVAAVMTGGEAWLGPIGPATGERPGWMDAWRRLRAGDPAGAAAPPSGDTWAGAATTVVANQLMREVVRRLSRSSEPSGPTRMTRVEPPSLRSQRHAFLPHPFARAAPPADQADLQATIGRLREGQRIEPEEFDRRVTASLDARLGVLGEVTERDFAQVPLAVSQVGVSDPVLLLGPDAPRPMATGADLSLAEARRAAVRRGLAAYGCLMVDPRRLHVRPGMPDPRTGDPDEDLASLRTGGWAGLVWGHGLADGRPHEVPAAAAFPALGGSEQVTPAGAAAGYDWDEAVRTGLVDRCRQLTLAEVAEGGHPSTPLDWDEVALDGHGERYRSLVRILGGRLEAHDVTGSAGVPTLAFRLGDATLAYGSGLSFGDALRDGLAQVLLAHQAEVNREIGYAPPPVPPLLSPGRPARVSPCPSWSTDESAIVARLAHLGWTAVAVPLDHDPAVTASVLPYLVHIVLTRG